MAEKGISTRLMTTAPSSAAYAKTASLLQPCWNLMRTWNYIIWERLEMASCRWGRDCFELIHSHLETIHPVSTCILYNITHNEEVVFPICFYFSHSLPHSHPNRHSVHTVPHCTGAFSGIFHWPLYNQNVIFSQGQQSSAGGLRRKSQ